MRRDLDHYADTLAMKDRQIGFLEGHVVGSAHPKHQPAILEAGRGRDQEKRMLAVLEVRAKWTFL
ncbi:MAG: hypothetical protein EHM20_11950 [Alphaproteobacteria bacterium]|nr:MAG: hypothetical protein EHM20_11950 [Alphaproteobacteria bacterium]